MKEPIRVLYLEDSPCDTELIQHRLNSIGDAVISSSVDDRSTRMNPVAETLAFSSIALA